MPSWVEQTRTKVYEQRQVAHLPFRPSGWQFRTRVIGSAPLTSEMKNAQFMLRVAEVSGLEQRMSAQFVIHDPARWTSRALGTRTGGGP